MLPAGKRNELISLEVSGGGYMEHGIRLQILLMGTRPLSGLAVLYSFLFVLSNRLSYPTGLDYETLSRQVKGIPI